MLIKEIGSISEMKCVGPLNEVKLTPPLEPPHLNTGVM